MDSVVIRNIAEKLGNIYLAETKYRTRKTDKIVPETGKLKHHNYFQNGKITVEDYIEHLTTDTAMTPVPIYHEDKCRWGALDIDTYDLTDEEMNNIVIGASRENLIPTRTKSGGLHLWAFASEEVPARFMRAKLMKSRDTLQLSPKTEIFPKQEQLKTGDNGNGITTPYRGYFSSKENNLKTVMLRVEDGILIDCPIGQFLDKAYKMSTNRYQFNFNYFKKFADYKDPVQFNEENSKKENKMTKKGILEAIKDGQEHSSGGTFDNWITLYIAKAVKDNDTDDAIKKKLDEVREYKNTEYKGGYDEAIHNKIEACRKKFDYPCPSIIQEETLKDVVYIASSDRYYVLSKRRGYRKEVLDTMYRKHFKKPLLSTFLAMDPNFIVAEDWAYRPNQYDPNNLIIEIDGLKYLNCYVPNTLEDLEGDITPFNKLLTFLFNGNKYHIRIFLDWLAYQLQNKGKKIRYCMVLISKEEQIGKGSLWRTIEKLFGEWNTKSIDISEATDHSKGYMKKKAIILIDEMESTGFHAEKKSIANSMKRVITEKKFSNRNRYSDYEEDGIETNINIMIYSNNIDAIAVPKNSKRYCVFYNDRPRLPEEFYINYHQWLDNETEAKDNGNHKNFKDGARHILYDLLNRDLSDFNPSATAPKTDGAKLMEDATAHPLAQLMKTHLKGNIFDPFKTDIVSTLFVYQHYQSTNNLKNTNLNKVAECLEWIGAEKYEQVPLYSAKDGKVGRTNLWVVRNHEVYRSMTKQDLARAYQKQTSERIQTPWNDPFKKEDPLF